MDINQYIQSRRAVGVPDEQIRGELLASGWQPAVVDQLFAQPQGPPAPLPTIDTHPQAYSEDLPSRGRNKKLMAILVVVAVIVVAAGATLFLSRMTQKTADKKPAASTESALKQNQVAVQRRQDVQALAAKVAEYQNDHNGALPATISITDIHSLRFCGATCDDATATKLTFDFDVSGVELHPYADKLQAPNSQALYLVPGAACNQHKDGAVASSSRAAALLYMVSIQGNSHKQECASI